MYTLKVTKTITVTNQDIDDIMCTALEGGITYWCSKAKVIGEYLGEYASEQISRGGVLMIYHEDEAPCDLTKEKLLEGVQRAIEEGWYADYEWYDANGIDTCNVDAEVADCIVQFALFGEVVYG